MMGEQEKVKNELKIKLIEFQNSIISCVEERFNKKLDDMKERINELGLMIQESEIRKNETVSKPKMPMEFIECPECAKKPGSPTLCPSCINNQFVIVNCLLDIEVLKEALKKERSK